MAGVSTKWLLPAETGFTVNFIQLPSGEVGTHYASATFSWWEGP